MAKSTFQVFQGGYQTPSELDVSIQGRLEDETAITSILMFENDKEARNFLLFLPNKVSDHFVQIGNKIATKWD